MTLRLRCRGLWPGFGPMRHGAWELRLGRQTIHSIGPTGRVGAKGYVIPAFVDAHWHMAWAGLEAGRLMLDEVRSRTELLSTLAKASVVGQGVLRAEKLDESSWTDARLPTLEELDRATGARPTFVRRICGHLALVNGALLERLPESLRRQARTTGVLRERPVLDFDRLVPPTAGELRGAVRHAEQRALREGVTAACSMEPLAEARALAGAVREIDLCVALFVDDLPRIEHAMLRDGLRRAAPGRRTRLFGVKLFLDGAIGARTAALACGYRDGSHPPLSYDDPTLRDLLLRVWRLGLTPVAHAIGGRAIEQIARVSLEARREAPQARALGVRIEHAEELGAVPAALWDPSFHRVCMQPNFVRRWQQPGGLYHRSLPTRAARELNPFRTALRRGLPLGFGSDGMPFGPRWGLLGAIQHPRARERISRQRALRAYSLGAAAICGMPHLARPLEVGRRADLVVLADDPMGAPSLAEAPILAVIARGRLVWADRTLESALRPG